MSDEGREGGAGEGGAERRAPPLVVRASLNLHVSQLGGTNCSLHVVKC